MNQSAGSAPGLAKEEVPYPLFLQKQPHRLWRKLKRQCEKQDYE